MNEYLMENPQDKKGAGIRPLTLALIQQNIIIITRLTALFTGLPR